MENVWIQFWLVTDSEEQKLTEWQIERQMLIVKYFNFKCSLFEVKKKEKKGKYLGGS